MTDCLCHMVPWVRPVPAGPHFTPEPIPRVAQHLQLYYYTAMLHVSPMTVVNAEY